jgi:hypothetical protein
MFGGWAIATAQSTMKVGRRLSLRPATSTSSHCCFWLQSELEKTCVRGNPEPLALGLLHGTFAAHMEALRIGRPEPEARVYFVNSKAE